MINKILDYLAMFGKDFIFLLCEMAPYLLLGFFFAGILGAFISKKYIAQNFGGKNFRSIFLASLFGVPLPLCSCGVIPTGIAFYKNGASKGSTVSFLISTPQTGVDSILATYALLGLPFAIIRPIIALITGILGGILTNLQDKGIIIKPEDTSDEESNLTFSKKVIKVFRYGFVEFLQDIAKWLFMGLLLAALVSVSVPNDFFVTNSFSPIVQMLAMLIISIPIYVCATGTIPLAAILILKGISPGAALVLLMAGPATNVATISMIGKVMGKRTLITYLLSIILGALTFGIIIDYVLPNTWFSPIMLLGEISTHNMHLGWLQITSGIILLILMINAYIRQKISSKNKGVETMANQTLKVNGMTCNHCKANVENNIKKLEFITDVNADLNTKQVILEGENIDIAKVKELIDNLGYSVEE